MAGGLAVRFAGPGPLEPLRFMAIVAGQRVWASLPCGSFCWDGRQLSQREQSQPAALDGRIGGSHSRLRARRYGGVWSWDRENNGSGLCDFIKRSWTDEPR